MMAVKENAVLEVKGRQKAARVMWRRQRLRVARRIIQQYYSIEWLIKHI